ncbi:MAG: hypothetical protein WAX29_01395 [Propionibacterium sp.]
MVTAHDSDSAQLVDLNPVSGANPRLRAVGDRITVSLPGSEDVQFARGDSREELALVTEYRTHVTSPGGGDVEFRGVLLRCLDGHALVWLANSPAAEAAYRSEDIARFCEGAGLRHDELTLDYAAVLRIAANARRLGEGTGRVSRLAEGVGRASGASIVLGTLLVFSALALGLIPHPTNEPGPIAAVAAGFLVLVFGFSWLGLHLASRPIARGRGRGVWIGAGLLALLVTVVFAAAGVQLAGLTVLSSCLVPAGIGLWLLGVPGLPWSLAATAPRAPQLLAAGQA